MKRIRICFLAFKYVLDSIKSIFINPKTGFSTNDERASQQLELVNNLFNPKGKRILIIGEGNNIYMSERLGKDNIVYSMDKYHKFISEKIIHINDDILKYHFGYLKFDLIISFYTLEHLNKVNKILIKLHGLLKNGGKCYHEIGLGNHGMFNDISKNYFKTFPKLLWKIIGHNKINGKDRDYYINHFGKYYSDFEVLSSNEKELGIVAVR